MIRRLRLTNWRAYEELELAFEPGTVFVVAPNGIGKTSLVEAAAWALFGHHAPPTNSPVRVGADRGVALVEVELPDQRVLAVERTYPATPPRKMPGASVHVDGVAIAPDDLDDLLRDAFRCDPAFLARIAMPRPHSEPATLDGPGLRDHLCRMFGVENLVTAGTELDSRIRESERRIKAAKLGGKVDRTRIQALEIEASDAATLADTHASALTRAREGLMQAEARARAAQAVEEWVLLEQERRTRAASIISESADLLQGPVDPETLRDVLTTALSETQTSLNAASRALGANEGMLRALDLTRQELYAGHADCPVCRRPLDEQTSETARAAHDRDRLALEQERRELVANEAKLAARIEGLKRASSQVASLPAPGPRPAAAPTSPATDISVEVARQTEGEALQAFVAVSAGRDNAQAALDQARHDETAHNTLIELFAADAVLKAARMTVEETVRVFVDGTVGPIASELGPRLASVLPGRNQVRVDGNGVVSRPVNGHDLGFESFSGGERTVALVLIRLLVVQMTTRATFCWFDEPLEHLDPDARRQVASLLAGAGSSEPMHQVVLTTYEQLLAERLAADNPDGVRVVAIRSA